MKDNQNLHAKLLRVKRRKRYDPLSKCCKNCNVSYSDKDNFNWSCVTHSGHWGGSVWWCCGKTKEYASGCLRKKHEPMEEEKMSGSDSSDIIKVPKCFVCR